MNTELLYWFGVFVLFSLLPILVSTGLIVQHLLTVLFLFPNTLHFVSHRCPSSLGVGGGRCGIWCSGMNPGALHVLCKLSTTALYPKLKLKNNVLEAWG